MRAKIRKIKNVFPVSVASAVYQEGTNKTLKDMIDNGDFSAKLNNRDMYAGEIFEIEETNPIDIPVKDGLVYFLDGRYINSDGKTWIDKVKKEKVVFPENYFEDDLAAFENNSLRIKSSIIDVRPYINNPIKDLTSYTVQVTYKYIWSTFWCGVLGTGNVKADYPNDFGFNISLAGAATYSFYPSEPLTTSRPAKVNANNKIMTTITVSPTEMHYYSNDIKCNNLPIQGTHVLHSNHFVLGGRKNNEGDDTGFGCVDGRADLYIYQVKFYNRVLTPEEISQNWAHEQTIDR